MFVWNYWRKFNYCNFTFRTENSIIHNEIIFLLLRNPDVTSVNPIYHKISKSESPTSTSRDGSRQQSSSKSLSKTSSNSKGVKSSSQSRGHGSASTSTSAKMRLRVRHEESDEEDERDWSEQCLHLLNEIYNKKDAVPFRKFFFATCHP